MQAERTRVGPRFRKKKKEKWLEKNLGFSETGSLARAPSLDGSSAFPMITYSTECPSRCTDWG